MGISPYTVKAGTGLLIGQPNIEPTRLLQILQQCFSKYKIISESYIAQIVLDADFAGSHLLVAVKASEELNAIFNDASHLIERELGKAGIVDFIDLSKSSQFSEHFREIEPFYRRA